MRRLLRVLGWILGVLVVAWLGVCAYFAVTRPRVTFTAAELARPAAPRTRPNFPSPLGGPRASAAARGVTHLAASR